MSNPTESATPPAEDHLEAAKKFAWGETGTAPEPKPDPTPKPKPETKPAAETKPDLLKGVVNFGSEPEAEQPPAPDDIAKGLTEPRPDSKSHAGWQELKKKGNEAMLLAASLQKELAAAKAAAVPAGIDESTKARIAELEAANKTYSERLKVVDTRNHPEFEAQFIKPQNDAKTALAAIAKEDEVDINIEDLLSLKGRSFNKGVSEAMEQMSPYAKVRFEAALQTYIKADLGAKSALAESDKFLTEARQNTGARSRGEFDKVASVVNRTFPAAVAAETATAEEKAEVESYNTALRETAKRAESYAFGQLNETGAAELAHKAALHDFVVQKGLPRVVGIFQRELTSRDTQIAALKAQVAGLTKAAPKFDGGGAGGVGGPDTGATAVEDHLAEAKKYDWGRQ